MSITRVVIKQHGTFYRLLRCEARPDGSLVVIIDRDPSPKQGGLVMRDGIVEKDHQNDGQVTPHGKFTCHTTGQVNYHKGGETKPHIFYGEPLHALTRPNGVCMYSIPRIGRLQAYLPSKKDDLVAEINVEADIDERMTFGLTLLPNDMPDPSSFALRLTYDIYSLSIGLINFPVRPEMTDHFVTAYPTEGLYSSRQVDIPVAELAFYQRILDGRPPIFREASGAYLLLASVPMRVPPRLNVFFDRADLQAEQIPIEGNAPTTHKVRFWIKDAGGRNKKDDLRSHITSVTLDAQL